LTAPVSHCSFCLLLSSSACSDVAASVIDSILLFAALQSERDRKGRIKPQPMELVMRSRQQWLLCLCELRSHFEHLVDSVLRLFDVAPLDPPPSLLPCVLRELSPDLISPLPLCHLQSTEAHNCSICARRAFVRCSSSAQPLQQAAKLKPQQKLPQLQQPHQQQPESSRTKQNPQFLPRMTSFPRQQRSQTKTESSCVPPSPQPQPKRRSQPRRPRRQRSP